MHREERRARLPDDPAYWSGLADRVDARVAPALAKRARGAATRPVWWARPELSPALAMGAVIVAGAAWLLVPTAGAPPEAVLEQALAPADPLATGLLTAEAPDLAALISSGATAPPVEED